MPKQKASIRTKIKDICKAAFIDPSEEFYEKAEAEIEKIITIEFVDKIRTELLKKARSGGDTPKPNPTAGK
jgi:hypothetical protein